MQATNRQLLRALGWSAFVILLAGCVEEREPFSPDVRVVPQAADAGVRVARVIEPVALGVPYPAGLAFSPRAGMLLVVPRLPGTPAGSETEIELVTLDEERAGSVRITAGVSDPLNLAFDGRANRLLVYESASEQLLQIAARADGSLDPQTLRRIAAGALGVADAQGLTVDPASGRLFILDGVGPRIVRVEPNTQLGFDNPTISEIDLAGSGLSDLRGLAFDPSSGRLHVLDQAALVLYELSATGAVVAARDLSRFGFRNIQGMTFGPSGDSTDDPNQMSLYVADSGVGGGSSYAESGQIAELSFVQAAAESAMLFATEMGTLIQTIDTWRFRPPSPDPAGITYLADVGRLLISDSEVNEMRIYDGANLFEVTLSGNLVNTGTTVPFSEEPTGVTWNPANGHLFTSNDDRI